jgi:FMN phosphatase YigB (HAD superfamily)
MLIRGLLDECRCRIPKELRVVIFDFDDTLLLNNGDVNAIHVNEIIRFFRSFGIVLILCTMTPLQQSKVDYLFDKMAVGISSHVSKMQMYKYIVESERCVPGEVLVFCVCPLNVLGASALQIKAVLQEKKLISWKDVHKGLSLYNPMLLRRSNSI